MKDLINNDKEILSESPVYEETNYKAFVRGGRVASIRNSSVQLSSELSLCRRTFSFWHSWSVLQCSINLHTKWDPNHYFPEQLEQKLNLRSIIFVSWV